MRISDRGVAASRVNRLAAVGAIAAGALVLSLQAGAGTKVYTITNGAFSDSEASCTRITTNLGGWDCSYGRNLPPPLTSRAKWLGPTFGGGHYPPGSIQADPAYRLPGGTPGIGGTTTGYRTGTNVSPVFNPAIADGKFEAPITGTFTIDDNDTLVNAADDKISSSFSIGALVRNIRTGANATAVQTWTSYDHSIYPTTVSSATANGIGGFDYVIGSRGWPAPICATYDGSDCFATQDAMADFQTPAGFWAQTNDVNYTKQIGIERTGVLADPSFYDSVQPPPAYPPTGNVGATSAAIAISLTCAGAYDDPAITTPDICATSQLVWGWTEPLGFDNIIMKISTDSTGAITSAQAYWSEEYYISYQSAPPEYDNSVDTGTFRFTAPAPGPIPNAQDDQAVVFQNTPTTIAVLGNDMGFLDPVTVLIFSIPTHGRAEVNNSPGNQSAISITYTPDLDYQGADSFAYSVGSGTSLDVATVSVVVNTDSDGDGIADSLDNCRTIGNPNQRDTNGDGYGNLCDADLDNSGFVNFTDLGLFKQKFATVDPDANLDGISLVNYADLAIFKSLFGKAPGPSGTTP